jgi:putative holliday junction resolvase
MTGCGYRTALAFDFGLRRIGVAIGNTLTMSARPLTTLAARDGDPDWAEIDRLVRDYAPQICIVGIPYNMDGSEATLAPRAREFAARLRDRAAAAIALVDERLSSRAADDVLREERAGGSRPRRVRSGDVDRMAAAILLMQWLRGIDSSRRPAAASDPFDGGGGK